MRRVMFGDFGAVLRAGFDDVLTTLNCRTRAPAVAPATRAGII